MKTWKTTGLALAACLAFVTAACQTEVRDDAVSKNPGVTVNGNNGQSATAIDGASNKADGEGSEQNIGSNDGSSSSRDSKGDSSANTTSIDDASAEGGATIGDGDRKEAVADKNTAVATVVGGNTIISNSGGTIHVRENVDQITITRSDMKVVAKTAKKISIQGSSVRVFVEQASSVDFNGSNNKVKWTSGSKPVVNNNGPDSEVEKAG